jgi:hypothetical protein
MQSWRGNLKHYVIKTNITVQALPVLFHMY